MTEYLIKDYGSDKYDGKGEPPLQVVSIGQLLELIDDPDNKPKITVYQISDCILDWS